MAQRQCPTCQVWTWNDDHTCLTYDGPPCATCGAPTLHYQVGAPGYGSGRACAAGHREELTPHGILTEQDVI